MEDTYKFLSSTEWWVSVVIAGITINVISAYMKTSLDGCLSKLSSWWRFRSEKNHNKELLYLEMLKHDEGFFELHKLKIINSIRWSVLWLLLGMMGFLLGSQFSLSILEHISFIGLMGISAVAFIRGFQHIFRTSKLMIQAQKVLTPDDT
ncbi:MAG: hypothetical protein ACRCYG_18835 [Aeromonas veronii]|uniref:hypothetical protein n=1 Tax=Aeromonas veronii TaxID=654 RepID=UPI0038D2951F